MRYRSYPSFRLSPIWIIIAVNLLLFLFILITIKAAPQLASSVVASLGLVPALFWSQPWTIVTSMFIHVEWWHIFTNMFTLYFFGTFLFRLVGERKFLFVYFAGGILGNILLLLLQGLFPFNIAIGASGAVFALAGALVMMVPKLKVFIIPIPIPLPLWVAVIGAFVILSIFGIAHLLPIAWQAHLGGLILGLIAGYFFKRGMHYYYR